MELLHLASIHIPPLIMKNVSNQSTQLEDSTLRDNREQRVGVVEDLRFVQQ